MIEILPNWHPAFVHFTVALLTISTFLFLADRFGKGRGWTTQARSAAYWNLWLGAGLTVFTVLAGFYAYNTVNHDDPSHAAMTDHRNWALVTAVLFWGLAIWAGRARRKGGGVSTGFLALLVVATGLLGTTGWKGGEVVYRYGLGVMSLPQVTPGGGDGHDHEHGGDASQATSPEADDDHDDDSSEAPEATDHNDGDHHDDAIAAPSQPQQSGHAHPEPTDGNLAAFHTSFQNALATGDFGTVASSFASDARVFEGGKAEASLEGYLEHHLKPEMPVIEQLNREVLSQVTYREGSTAWISTEARIWGNIEGRDIDVSHAETMNLVFDHDSWKIAHVHWSSRPNKKE